MKKQFLGCVVTMLMTISAAVAAKAEEPSTWWVNAKNYVEGLTTPEEYAARGFDGTTPEKGFGTIQIGVDKSAEGDTINVKEGVYDKGSTVMWNNNTRVVVSGKNVTIVGVDGWQKTFIVGYQTKGEEGDDGRGNGPNAVRCVAAKGSMRMSNFTICGGATICADPSTGTTYCGGGVTADGTSCVFTDCMISNNICARYGSAAHKGTYLRCRFFNNTAISAGAATYFVMAFSCVFSGNNNVNGSNHNIESSGSSIFLNCTVVGNPDSTFGKSTGYNCLFSMNSYESECDQTKLFSTVMSADGPVATVAAPLGDFRLVSGAPAVGAADMKYLTTEMPFDPADPDGKIRDFNGNVIDTTAATLNAGACQEVVTPAYGGVLIDSTATVNGMSCYGTNLTFSTSWPVLLKVNPNSSSMFRYAVSGSAPEDLGSRYRGMDGILHIVPPYEAGAIQTNVVVANKNSRKAEDYATLDEIQVAYTSSSNPVTISVPEGDYATGGSIDRGVSNRISRTKGGWIAYTATGDVGKTIIRGAAASEPREDVTYPGCGADAARCVNLNFSGSQAHTCLIFRGITFADGRTDCGQDADNDQGGAVYGRPHKDGLNRRSSLTFMDCVFTNCWAPDAGVGVNARFIRCKFIDCGSAGVGFKNCVLASCTFENCDFKGGTFGKDCVTVGCSDPSAQAASAASGQIHLNSNFGFGTVFPDSAKVFGATGAGFFADATKGDLRPISGSAALDAARRAFPEDADDFALCAAYMSAYATDSYDRREWTFGGDFPIAGAFMEWVRGCSFATDTPEAYTFAGGKTLQPGESVTIARQADAVRHYGLVANGVTNMLDTGAYVYTQPANGGMNDGAIIGILDPNWYVNPDPTIGDDAANGFTPQTARRTLEGIFAVATNAGDIVHAAAGTYDAGEVQDESSYTNRAYLGTAKTRCAIPANVTLIGEGAESTILDCTGSHRGVFLNKGSKIVGLTIQNCLASDGYGFAVYGVNDSDVVADCIIQDNKGERYAMSTVAAIIRSRFYRNMATDLAAIGSTIKLYNCLIGAGNSGGYCTYQGGSLYNCTILGKLPPARKNISLYNCLSLAPGRNDGSYKINWYNSYYTSEKYDSDIMDDACVRKAPEELVVGEDGVPVIGSNAAIDQADEARYCNAYPSSLDPEPDGVNLDLYKRPRFLNAGLDVGCCEADHLSAYASRICKGHANRIEVISATPKTVLDGGDCVTLGNGGVIAFRPIKVRESMFKVTTPGDGVVTVTEDGVRVEPETDGSYKVFGGEGEHLVVVSYDGDTQEDTAAVFGLSSCSGLVMVVR